MLFFFLKPYVRFSEDLFAQGLQLFLTLVLAVGLLTLVGDDSQGEEYGVILVVCVVLILLSIFLLVVGEAITLVHLFRPEQYKSMKVKVKSCFQFVFCFAHCNKEKKLEVEMTSTRPFRSTSRATIVASTLRKKSSGFMGNNKFFRSFVSNVESMAGDSSSDEDMTAEEVVVANDNKFFRGFVSNVESMASDSSSDEGMTAEEMDSLAYLDSESALASERIVTII
jgi:hypothetical protein